MGVRGQEGKAPLHWAAAGGHTETCRMLISEFKADVAVGNAVRICASLGFVESGVVTRVGCVLRRRVTPARGGGAPLGCGGRAYRDMPRVDIGVQG